jgi:hypothetical protein
MTNRNFIIIIIIGLTNPAFAQKVTYNYLIDTANIEVKQVQRLFENYIHSRPDSIYNNPYWSDTDKQNKGHFDILFGEFQPSLYMGFPVHVLSIKSHNDIYEIKAMFSSCRQDNQPYVLAIMNYIAKKESNVYKLSNYLNYSRTLWTKQKIGLVTFYYPPYHQFDTLKANNLNDFSIRLCKNLNIDMVKYEYYLADDFDELQKLKGIDYYIGMGGEVKPTGRGGNYRAFCSGMGENYFHEPFHIFIGDNFKCHLWANEGAATYFGGSRGQDLIWHLIKVNDYLHLNKNIDLSDMLTLQTLDEYTDFRYAIGGFIVKLVFEKGGWTLLKQFLNSGNTDNEYYLSIEKCLGVKRKELNNYLRQEINNEVKKRSTTR